MNLAARNLYHRIYDVVCGTHPHVRMWHPQWLAVKDLYADLRRVLPELQGRVLDVGCGDKPYAVWLNSKLIQHVGLDVCAGPSTDLVVRPGERWPVDSGVVAAVLCTQTLEHVADMEGFLSEIDRVLAPGGSLIVTVPFIYNFHIQTDGSDYRRFSLEGVKVLFADYRIIELKSQGGIGSSLGLLLLNWIDISLNRNPATRVIKGLLLPAMILFYAIVNLSGWLVDWIDNTQSFYSNVMLVAQKREICPEDPHGPRSQLTNGSLSSMA